jgi:dethiobiotin synthetase
MPFGKKKMQAYFITGTDTDVGKTYFTAWLTRQWHQRGWSAAALKPISAGDQADALALQTAANHVLTLAEITLYHFQHPVTPYVAAPLENQTIDFNAIQNAVQLQQKYFSHLAVEGVGGWLAPLAPHVTVREWAQQLKLPVVVVARAGLGTLNHTLLTVESIRAAGLTCAGIVLNDYPASPGLARDTNPQVLQEWTQRPLFVFNQAAEQTGLVPDWLL